MVLVSADGLKVLREGFRGFLSDDTFFAFLDGVMACRSRGALVGLLREFLGFGDESKGVFCFRVVVECVDVVGDVPVGFGRAEFFLLKLLLLGDGVFVGDFGLTRYFFECGRDGLVERGVLLVVGCRGGDVFVLNPKFLKGGVL